MSIKEFSITPSGIETATFRVVAQCLDQLRYRVQFLYTKYSANKPMLIAWPLFGLRKFETARTGIEKQTFCRADRCTARIALSIQTEREK